MCLHKYTHTYIYRAKENKFGKMLSWWIQEKGKLVFTTLISQLLCGSEIFQNKNWGGKQKGTKNLAKPNNLIQVFKEALLVRKGFPDGLSGKESTCQCRRRKRPGFDPWVRKIPWRRKWEILEFWYSCLGNLMDRGGWWAIVHRVTKSWTQLKRLSTHTHLVKKTTKKEVAPGEGNTIVISGRTREVGETWAVAELSFLTWSKNTGWAL